MNTVRTKTATIPTRRQKASCPAMWSALSKIASNASAWRQNHQLPGASRGAERPKQTGTRALGFRKRMVSVRRPHACSSGTDSTGAETGRAWVNARCAHCAAQDTPGRQADSVTSAASGKSWMCPTTIRRRTIVNERTSLEIEWQTWRRFAVQRGPRAKRCAQMVSKLFRNVPFLTHERMSLC